MKKQFKPLTPAAPYARVSRDRRDVGSLGGRL